MLARRWRLRSSASQSGSEARRGGARGSTGPWIGQLMIPRRRLVGQPTPSSSRPSRRWRGTIVTISISARKAISEGVMPRGRGNAIEVHSREEHRMNKISTLSFTFTAPCRACV